MKAPPCQLRIREFSICPPTHSRTPSVRKLFLLTDDDAPPGRIWRGDFCALKIARSRNLISCLWTITLARINPVISHVLFEFAMRLPKENHWDSSLDWGMRHCNINIYIYLEKWRKFACTILMAKTRRLFCKKISLWTYTPKIWPLSDLASDQELPYTISIINPFHSASFSQHSPPKLSLRSLGDICVGIYGPHFEMFAPLLIKFFRCF